MSGEGGIGTATGNFFSRAQVRCFARVFSGTVTLRENEPSRKLKTKKEGRKGRDETGTVVIIIIAIIASVGTGGVIPSPASQLAFRERPACIITTIIGLHRHHPLVCQ